MVTRIVQRVVGYLKPPLTFEDLVSAGTVGLVKAARDYDPTQQANFKTYAYIRIKGAVLDELRGWSFVPSNHNKQIRQVTEASQRLLKQTGRTPSDQELAAEIDIPLEKLYETFQDARAKNFASIDSTVANESTLTDLLASAKADDPEKETQYNEMLEKLTKAISELDERKKQIILLYYQQNLTMKQIAQVFEITEPRISQLHAAALFSLSVKLKDV